MSQELRTARLPRPHVLVGSGGRTPGYILVVIPVITGPSAASCRNPLRTARDSCPSCRSSLHERPSRDAAALTTAFTIRTGSRQTIHATFFPARECRSGERPGAAPASISAADISACLPESVGRGSLVMEDPREVSPLSRRGDVIRGGLTLYPIHYSSALAFSLIPSPLPHQLPLQVTFPCGRGNGVTSFIFSITPGVRSCFSAGGAPSATEEYRAPVPDHLPFGSSLTAS